MDRVTEPELMTSNEQVQAYSQEDFSLTDNAFLSDLESFMLREGIEINAKSSIFDLGCGPGNITEIIWRKWPKAKVIGIDGSKEMLDIALMRAKDLIKNQGLKRISYIQKNISSICHEENDLAESADVVVSNSLLHHIHDPKIFWQTVKKVASKGAVQFHRDLRRPSSFSDAIYLQEKYLLNAPQILKRDYLASLMASFTVEEVRSQLLHAGLEVLNVSEVEDRYLEIKGIL